jgi:pSer/pThr/pTyr-binding forkhead associated (FHA) protein
MAKLVLSMDGLVLKEIVLAKDRTTIGRKPHNDIQIDNLAISGEHAAITTILNDSFLEDLNSTNGTYVNGQPIRKHFLQNNDVVELGKYRLKYLAEASAGGQPIQTISMTAEPAAAAVGAESSSGPTTTQPLAKSNVLEGAAAQATLQEPQAPVGAIKILNGANAGRRLELTKTLTTLGKAGSQVAVITRRPNGYFITHVEGPKFPVLNGSPLDSQAHPLTDADVIELAGVRMEFSFKA